MPFYGILGRGGNNPSAISAALGDLPEDSTFIIGSRLTNGTEAVFDWMIDNEKPFTIVGDVRSKTLFAAAEQVIKFDGNPDDYIIEQPVDTVLVLWEDGIEDTIYSAFRAGIPILELTNGLIPITVTEDEPQVEEEVQQEPEAAPFTEGELRNMPAAAVKRYAVNMNIDIKGLTKDEIISRIFPPAQDLPAQAPVVLPATVPMEEEPEQVKPVAIIVVLNNGFTMQLHAPSASLEKLVTALSSI